MRSHASRAMGRTIRNRVVAVTLAAAAAGWACHGEHRPDVPSSSLVLIRPDVAVEVVDWGGRGDPVLLLAGLGNTAHVFDGFAQGLTSRHHVLGMTRRGFGASSQPEGGYDPTTRAEDIRLLLDHLGISRIILIGHSLAGDEMTLVARQHPERVTALVYLEAAYQFVSGLAWEASHPAPASTSPDPVPGDSASPAAWQAYFERATGDRLPLAEIEAFYRWGKDGRLADQVTPPRVYSQIVDSLADPDYDGIAVPALAVYATDVPVTSLFVDYPSRDSATQDSMRVYRNASMEMAATSRAHFRTHMMNGRVVEIRGAVHRIWLRHGAETLTAVNGFLHGLAPGPARDTTSGTRSARGISTFASQNAPPDQTETAPRDAVPDPRHRG